MIDKTNENKKARNAKTGNIGWIICQYNRTTDNTHMTEVKTITGNKAHWKTSQVEI